MNHLKYTFLGTFLVSLIFSIIIYLRVNMGPSGEGFIPIFIWQLVVWSPWLLFGYLNNQLDRKYPIVEQSIIVWGLRHSLLCGIIISMHIAWFFFVSNNFSPFLGMDNTNFGAFFFFFIMWGICDFLFYWSLLGIYALRQLLSISPSENDSFLMKPDYFSLKTTGRQSSVRIENIIWIEAEDYCCRVHTNDNDYLVRQSLSSFEKTLPNLKFLRIHRSTIVNITQIEMIEKQENRRHIVRLKNGVERFASPHGADKLQEILKF